MDKKKFDKIMNQWAAHEMEAAPDLSPSPEVYQKLEENKKKPRFALFSWPVRLAAAGIAAALIILVIVIEPPREVGPLLGLRKSSVADVEEKEAAEDRMQVLGEVEGVTEEKAGKEVDKEAEEKMRDVPKTQPAKLRQKVQEEVKPDRVEEKATVAKEPLAKPKMGDVIEKTKEADKEGLVQPLEVAARQRMAEKPAKKDVKSEVKRSPVAVVTAAAPAQIQPEKIEFQFQIKGTETIKGVDVDSLQDEILSLSSEDNYRLKLLLAESSYVYVFQVGAKDHPVRLFPNPEYSPFNNPLQAGKIAFVPLPPNWFFVEREDGEINLYVVTSDEPLHDWDDAETQVTTGWLNRLKENDRVSVRVFKFKVI